MNSPTPACRVSIVIKALNEEKRIAKAVQSALAAVQSLGGEVVLADSFSTDRTVEIASAFPIRIVQLSNPQERCCGIGPQLGYQHSIGEFVYILDGDMEMQPGFLPKAVALMDARPELAGVGGTIIEMNTTSLEYVARVERGTAHLQAGDVDRLDGGGLYRRVAVEDAGYLSDRNLHSYEEFDLAVRLSAKGWQFHRVDEPAVRHYGHDTPPYQLLMRRWRSRYIDGLGELVRAAWGQAHFTNVLRGVRELRIYAIVVVWWMTMLLIWVLPMHYLLALGTFSIVLFAPFGLMTVRKRSLKKAVFSVVSWSFNGAGLLRGLVSSRVSPHAPIQSKLVK